MALLVIKGRQITLSPAQQSCSKYWINDRIASFLYAYFLQLGIPYDRLSMKTQIAVSGKLANARQPAHKVTILQWMDGLYEDKEYQAGETIMSPFFPVLT